MAETISIERDEDTYWRLGTAFMRILMLEANDVLKECGVDDCHLRQRIAERLGFGLGNFFDQCWLEADGRRYYPFLCFAERFAGETPSAETLGTIQGPSPYVELHAMACDEADWFFKEQKEDEAAVPMGVYEGDGNAG